MFPAPMPFRISRRRPPTPLLRLMILSRKSCVPVPQRTVLTVGPGRSSLQLQRVDIGVRRVRQVFPVVRGEHAGIIVNGEKIRRRSAVGMNGRGTLGDGRYRRVVS